jgi:hypothetical protein
MSDSPGANRMVARLASPDAYLHDIGLFTDYTSPFVQNRRRIQRPFERQTLNGTGTPWKTEFSSTPEHRLTSTRTR